MVDRKAALALRRQRRTICAVEPKKGRVSSFASRRGEREPVESRVAWLPRFRPPRVVEGHETDRRAGAGCIQAGIVHETIRFR